MSYTATLAASSTLTSAPLTNTAQVTHYESLASGGRSYVGPSDTATITPAFPHISLAKRASAGPAYIGESKAFTLTITSDGAATAHDIGGTDTLPPNWTYDPGSAMVSVAGGAGGPGRARRGDQRQRADPEPARTSSTCRSGRTS